MSNTLKSKTCPDYRTLSTMPLHDMVSKVTVDTRINNHQIDVAYLMQSCDSARILAVPQCKSPER